MICVNSCAYIEYLPADIVSWLIKILEFQVSCLNSAAYCPKISGFVRGLWGGRLTSTLLGGGKAVGIMPRGVPLYVTRTQLPKFFFKGRDHFRN
jgi:hypothetical protein